MKNLLFTKAFTLMLLMGCFQFTNAQTTCTTGTVQTFQKISDTEGGFTGVLDDGDWIGGSLCNLGDLDGDGVNDIVVGTTSDDDGGTDYGALWVLFMNTDGTVKSHQKISDTEGGFTGTLTYYTGFGGVMESLGDLDGDGVIDIAVGAARDEDGGTRHGAVWILFLNSDGTIKSHQKISDTQGGFTGTLDVDDYFGIAISSLGDLDNDGITDIAVGVRNDDDGGTDRGALWILFLNTDGTVKSEQKISDTQGSFTGILDDYDAFGWSLASLGDIDADGVTDLLAGARLDDDGGTDHGALWILFLNTNGTVKAYQKISDTEGNFTGTLDDIDYFGQSVLSIGDLNGDGFNEIAVGATRDDDGGTDRGAVYILSLCTEEVVQTTCTTGTVQTFQKISDTEGSFTGTLDNGDLFGLGVSNIGDLDGDGITDMVVGACRDDDGASDAGAVWILFMNADKTVKSYQKISNTQGNIGFTINAGDEFGFAVASIGDLNNDGTPDIAVGAKYHDDGAVNSGAVWILFLNTDGTVKAYQKISNTQGGFTGTIGKECFGEFLSPIDDLNGDGITDLAVGARYGSDGTAKDGAVWILFLNTDGTVKENHKISKTDGNFNGVLDDYDYFGSVASIGDINGDNIIDLAVGAQSDDDGGSNRGAVWVLFMNTDGTVKSYQKISDTQGDFTGVLNNDDVFGASVGNIGDLDGDGITDIIVGAMLDNDGGTDRGAVWILFLNSNGTVKTYQKISSTQGNFTANLDNYDWFGIAIYSIGDIDGDGNTEIAVGARADDDGGTDRGAVYILSLCTVQKDESCVHEISGTVSAGTTPLVTGTAYLYNAIADSASTTLYSTEVKEGQYTFSNVCDGDYKIMAVAKGSDISLYYPTYYVNTLYWDYAYSIGVSTDIDNVNIDLIATATSIVQYSDNSSLHIYPNPSNGDFYMEIDGTDNNAKYSISVLDILGKEVYYEEDVAASIKAIHLNNPSKGVYFMQLVNEENVLNVKLVVN